MMCSLSLDPDEAGNPGLPQICDLIADLHLLI